MPGGAASDRQKRKIHYSIFAFARSGQGGELGALFGMSFPYPGKRRERLEDSDDLYIRAAGLLVVGPPPRRADQRRGAWLPGGQEQGP